MDSVTFYSINNENGYLSNFAQYPVFIDGAIWPTTEHYFQASKFTDEWVKEKVKSIESPLKAAKEGRKNSNPLRKDWEEIKTSVMKHALEKKFLQYHNLKIKLLDTEDKKIIEHTFNDHYWGDGGDGSGLNMLGILLMEVREKINKICSNKNWVFPPWIAFENIDQNDMFWRMGLGESYLYTWAKWYNFESQSVQTDYQKLFPEIASWQGFY